MGIIFYQILSMKIKNTFSYSEFNIGGNIKAFIPPNFLIIKIFKPTRKEYRPSPNLHHYYLNRLSEYIEFNLGGKIKD